MLNYLGLLVMMDGTHKARQISMTKWCNHLAVWAIISAISAHGKENV